LLFASGRQSLGSRQERKPAYFEVSGFSLEQQNFVLGAGGPTNGIIVSVGCEVADFFDLEVTLNLDHHDCVNSVSDARKQHPLVGAGKYSAVDEICLTICRH